MRAALEAVAFAIGFAILIVVVLCILPYAFISVSTQMFKEWRAGKKIRIWGFN